MKKNICILIVFLFSTLMLQAKVSSFSIVCTGNFKGEYKDLDRIYTLIQDVNKKRENIIFINAGNNIGKNKVEHSVFSKFFQEAKFDFNLLAKQEYENLSYKNDKLKYSSINVIEDEIFPYKLIRSDNSIVAFVGITDIYDEFLKDAVDYEVELKKLMYRLEEVAEFIFVVSDLKRAENVSILQKHKEITALFEGGDESITSGIEKINFSYLVPIKNFHLLDFSAKDKVNKILSKHSKKFSQKNMNLQGSYEISDYSYYEGNSMMKNYILWTKDKLKIDKNTILGYNPSSFYKTNAMFSEHIDFFEKIAKKIRGHFRADIVAIPSKSVKSGLKQGMYSKEEIADIFTNDKIIEIAIKKDELDKLIRATGRNKGNPKFLYFSGNNNLGRKKVYKLIALETIQNDYPEIKFKSTTVKKLTLNEFLLGR